MKAAYRVALIPRERQMAILVGRGWDNKTIAGRLGYVMYSGLTSLVARWGWEHEPREWEANT